MSNNRLWQLVVSTTLALSMVDVATAALPKFTIVPVVPSSNYVTTIPGDVIHISYLVTNDLMTTKTLQMQSLAAYGITQRTRGTGICPDPFTLAPGESCTLRLRIDGRQSLAGTTTLLQGPEICIANSCPLACTKPSPSNLLQINVLGASQVGILTISSFDMVTATTTVTAPSSGVRILLVKNIGQAVAQNITYTFSPALPAGTTVTGMCPTINAGSTCTLTLHPGAIPSTSTNTSPDPSVLTIVGSYTNKLETDITILMYGNIYQGGYVYAVDVSTPLTQSVSGETVGLTDVSSSIRWGDGTFNTNTNFTDGSINTSTIISVQGANAPYAAPACGRVQVNEVGQSCSLVGSTCFANWYLPATCQLSTGDAFSNCSGQQNIFTNVPFAMTTGNQYWSSTFLTFLRGSGAYIAPTPEVEPQTSYFHDRCARTFT